MATDRKSSGIKGDKAPSSLGFLLSQVGIYASRRFAQRIGALDLHPGLFRILNLVEATEGQSQHAIGDAIEVPASRMVALVDELEQRGLVERRPDPDDRRVRVLHLTLKGRRLLERGQKIAAEHEADLTKGMSPADRERLMSLLRELADNQGLAAGVHPGLSER